MASPPLPDEPSRAVPVAAVWPRALAALVDYLLVVVLVTFVFLLGSEDAEELGDRLDARSPSVVLSVTAILLAYFFVAEAMTGRTVGKRLFGLRVARLDGSRAGPGPILARTLGRLVDEQLATPLVGLAAMVLDRRRHQRIGDRLGRTVVVRDPVAGRRRGR